MSKIPVIAVVGPTASGKTSLAVEIAKRYNGEIISADSMQIYKGMPIATAQPTVKEMENIPHHLIAFADINEKFSVADYVTLAKEKIESIYKDGKTPIIAGGTGLYINALFNLSFDESKSDDNLRAKLESEFEQNGGQAMLNRLNLIDKETADKLHPSDKKRIIRALEIYELSGKTKTEIDKLAQNTESPYSVCYIGINYKDREKLYARINMRVDEMINMGLIDEAKKYADINPSFTSAQAIGYKELSPHFKGEDSLDNCIDNLKKETRHYAKRQLTWFRRDKNIKWFYPDTYLDNDELISEVTDYINRFMKGETANEI